MAWGGVMMLAALSFVPAIVRDHNDIGLIGVGASLFSFGTLVVAGGFYLKARLLPATARPAEAAAPPKRSRGGCELCKGDVPIIHCKVHQLHLCATCMAEHYDFRSCAYVPSTRTKAGKAARAHSA